MDIRDSDVEDDLTAASTALHRARAAAAMRGDRPGKQALTRAAKSKRRPDTSARSGAAPDARDPQLVSSTINRLVTDRGWNKDVAVAGVIGRWAEVVGAEVAAHCQPETFEDGVLVVRADSSAWATQVRLLMPTLQRRLAEEVGEGTVTSISVKGPSAPSWRRGNRVAPGSKGPGDTYG